MSGNESSTSASNPLRWAGPITVAAAAVAMTIWSWRTWPDPVIDFGQQLYVAWRLTEGDVLYRDLAYLYGPLSPWLNAAWFRVFGVGFIQLSVANLTVIAGVIALLYRVLARIGGRVAATIACVTFVTSFAFGQLVEYGNYNFVSPYVNNLTHGVALALLAIYGVDLHRRRRGMPSLAGVGLAVGLLFLTKAEVFLAGSAAVACGLVLAWREEELPPRQLLRRVVLVLGCAGLPVAIAVGILAGAMPLATAIRGVLGTWPAILSGVVGHLDFYRWSMGALDPGRSLWAMGTSLALYGSLLVPPTALALALRRPRHARMARMVTVGVFSAVVGVLVWQRFWWPATVNALPLVLLGLGAIDAAHLLRGSMTQQERGRRFLSLTMTVFAFVLLAKILFNVRTFHYGFALAMPATLLAVVALFDRLPRWLRRAGGSRGPIVAAAIAVWGAFVLGHLEETRDRFEHKTEVVSAGRDAFHADRRGAQVNAVLDRIESTTEAGHTLAVLPAGVMLNYLARRQAPTPFLYFMPSDFLMYGEQQMLDRFRKTPPDFVVLVHKDTSEFGARFFGRDYGQPLFQWIRESYTTVEVFGAVPLQGERFGMVLLKRRAVEVGPGDLSPEAP